MLQLWRKLTVGCGPFQCPALSYPQQVCGLQRGGARQLLVQRQDRQLVRRQDRQLIRRQDQQLVRRRDQQLVRDCLGRVWRGPSCGCHGQQHHNSDKRQSQQRLGWVGCPRRLQRVSWRSRCKVSWRPLLPPKFLMSLTALAFRTTSLVIGTI